MEKQGWVRGFDKTMEENRIIQSVRQWIEYFVVKLNLCPFARSELLNNQIRFSVTDAMTEEQLLIALRIEFALLNKDFGIETTLLIHPNVLQKFYDYNQFLGVANNLLVEMQLEGVYQIASFHPNYQFAGTAPEDVENYTNRSPYPILHILREDSLERAISHYPNVEQIPTRNIELMNRLGRKKLEDLRQKCLKNH